MTNYGLEYFLAARLLGYTIISTSDDLIQKQKISMSIITIEFDLVHDSVCVDKLSLTTFLSVIKLSIVRELIKKFSFSDYLNFEEIT